MADLATVPAQVKLSGSGQRIRRNLVAGELVEAGDVAYLDTTTNKWKKANANTDAASVVTVLAISTAEADGQEFTGVTEGDVELGAGAAPAAGTVYYASPNAGKFAPLADLLAGKFLTPLGIGIGGNAVRFKPNYSGQTV